MQAAQNQQRCSTSQILREFVSEKAQITERFVLVEDGFSIWTAQITSKEAEGKTPLLALHGGPGAGHNYIASLAALADPNNPICKLKPEICRPVIFYDQLGCGLSDQPNEPNRWQIPRFVNEVNTVREALDLKQIHLLGQSWGGWLAIEYMLNQPNGFPPKGIKSLTLASTSASIHQFVQEANKLKTQLPTDHYQAMLHHEEREEYEHPTYLAAVDVFYRRHVCRLSPWPKAFEQTVANLDQNQVYATMNGPNEFVVNQLLKTWDQTQRIHEINCPTLITVGQHDEITPACSQTMHQAISNSQLHIFKESGHVAHLEEAESYLQTLGFFCSKI